jgi:hypothetical protein
MLFLITVTPDSNYQIYGDKVYSNSTQALYADYIANVTEDEWPVYFAKMIEYALAMDFAASIRDSSSGGLCECVPYGAIHGLSAVSYGAN